MKSSTRKNIEINKFWRAFFTFVIPILFLTLIVATSYYYNYQTTATDNLIFKNRTEGSNLGARLSAPVLFMDFNDAPIYPLTTIPSAYNSSNHIYNYTYQRDNSIYNNYGSMSGYSSNLIWHNQEKVNYSLIFDGSDDSINLGDNIDIGASQNFSLGAWVKFTGTENGGIITKRNNGGANAGYDLNINASGFPLMSIKATGGAASTNTFYSNISISGGNWHHVFVTMDRFGNGTMYIDGIVRSIKDISNQNGSLANSVVLRIGLDGSVLSFFKGSIDEAMIFNRTLSSTEVLNLYNNQSAGLRSSGLETDANLVSYWYLDELLGTIALDIKGGNDGTIANYPTANTPIYNSTGGYDGSGAYQFDGVNDIITSTLSSALTDYTVSAWIKNSTATSWSHIVWASDGVNYTNGLVSNPIEKPVNISSTNVKIGVQGATYFNGTIDQIQIFNRILGADEVLNIYNGTINNSNYIGSYNLKGDFKSLVFYNSSSSYWNMSFSLADTYSPRTGVVNNKNEINTSNPNMVAYWKLDGNALNALGILNGTPSGTVTNGTGISSMAMNFNGADSHINVTDNGDLNRSLSGDFTWSVWARPNAASNMILNKRVSSGTNVGILLDATTNGATRLVIDIGASNPAITGSVINDGLWHYLTAVRNGTNVSLYENGVIVNSTNGTGYNTNLASAGIFSIGDRPDWASANREPINGSIDEVIIYNKSLSPSEILSIYKSGLSQHANTNVTLQYRTANNYNLSDSNLISLWAFNGDTSLGETSTLFVDLARTMNGTCTGNTCANITTNGTVGDGASFDGTDDFVNLTRYPNIENISEFTISAWIYPRVKTSNSGIFAKHQTNSANSTNFLMSSASGDLFLRVTNNSADSYARSAVNTVISANNWYYVSAVYNGSATTNDTRIRLYINGVNQSLVFAGRQIPARTGITTAETYIGRYLSSGTSVYFNGIIDELRIYNRSLSDSEIVNLYNLGNTHISDWSAWSNEQVVSDNVAQVTSSSSKFLQFRNNLYTNATQVSPYVLNYNVTLLNITVNINISYPLATLYPPNINALNYSATGTNSLDRCWCSNSSGIWNSSSVAAGTNFTGINSTGGSNTWTVYCNDSFGIMGSSSVSFTIDATNPNATLNTPPNNTYSSNLTQNLTANLSDNIGIANATLNIYNSTSLVNQTTTSFIAGTTTTIVGVVVNLVDNAYTWFYQLFDTVGNSFTSSNRTLNLDTTYPNINFTNPTPISGATQQASSIIINLSTSDTSSIYSFVNFDNSTLSWWRMQQGNGTFFADYFGRNNGTCTGATCPIYNQYGKFGGAQSFVTNATWNSYITIGSNLNLNFTNSSDYTLSAWININGANGDNAGNVIFGRYASSKGYILGHYNDARGLYLMSDSTNITSNYALTSSVWYQVAYLKNSSGQFLFVNGNNVTSLNSASYPSLAGSGANAYIGAYISGSPVGLFNGSIDEILVFNRSLSLNEIKVLYDANTNQYYNNFSNLSQSSHNFKAYAIDLVGNLNTTETRTVTINANPPQINFTSPSELSGSYFNRNNLQINVTANATGTISNITLNLYNSTSLVNSTITASSPNYVNITNLGDGIYYFNATAIDDTNNANSTETRNVTLDNAKPLIDYGTGTLNSGINVSQNFVYINVSVTETNEANITFRIANSSWSNTSTYSAGTRTINFTDLADGTYYYNVSIIDLALNTNITSTRIIILDRTAPNATLNTPPNNTYSSNLTQNLTANLSDNIGIANATLNIYNSSGLFNSTLINYASNTVQTTTGIVVTFIDGAYNWFYSLFDWAGNQFTTGNRTITIDTTNPVISNILPVANTNYNISNIVQISINITESYGINSVIANITYPNSSSEIKTLSNSIGDKYNNSLTAPNLIGRYNISFRVNDTAGNINNSETSYFVVHDNILPSASFTTAPENSSTKGTNITTFIADISDNIEVGDCILSLETSGTWANYSMTKTGAVTTATCNLTLEIINGTHSFILYFNDSSGNLNYTQIRTYLIDLNVPDIQFKSPTETSNSYISRNNIVINVTATTQGANLSNITVRLYNSTNSLINSSLTTSSPNYINLTNLLEGLYRFNSSALDELSRESLTETRIITIDTTKPLINYGYNALNQSYASQSSIYVNVTITETNEANITFNLYNSTSLVGSQALGAGNRTVNFTSLTDGIYFYNVSVRDLANNINSTETRNITLDTTKSLIDYGTGTLNSGINVSQNFVYINVSVTETNEANITFRIANSSWSNTSTYSAGTRTINFTDLADGTYYYNVSIIDLALNTNITSTRIIILDKTAPNATLNTPPNNTYSSNLTQNLTANLSENIGIANATLNIYNSSGLFNSTLINYASNTVQTTTGIVVTFIDGAYNWFYSLFDWAGNQFTTGNRTITIDTIYPIIEFGEGTSNDGAFSNRNNVYVNISAYDLNEANVTFKLYNSTSLFNSTTFSAETRTINFTNLEDGTYYYNVSIIDLANNINITQTRSISIGTRPPAITNILYFPNSSDNVDPGANITFNATVSSAGILNVSSVIFEYSYGSSWSNITMTSLGGNIYQANITLVNSEANYSYIIFANDTAGNSNQTSTYLFNSSWDCSWTVSPSNLGAYTGFGETKSLGTITINNTGDSQFSSNNCSLRYLLSSNTGSGRVYYDGDNVEPAGYYNINAGSSTSIAMSARFLTATNSESLIISVEEKRGISSQNLSNVSATLVTASGDQPYLYQTIDTSSSVLYLTPSNFSISAYIKNLVGDGSIAKAARNVSYNWSLPSYFVVAGGTASEDSLYLDTNTPYYTSINLSFNSTNLPSLSQGIYNLSLSSQGYNSTSSPIANVNNETTLINFLNLTLICYSPADNIVIPSCGILDGDYVATNTVTVTTTGSGSGSGGGGSSTQVKIEKSEANFELLRGKMQEFSFEIKNKYDAEMRNINISVSGLNSEFISINPSSISSIPGKSSRNITVKINAPAYFTGNKYTLIFDIAGRLFENDSTSEGIRITDKKSVTLYIVEITRGEALILMNESGFMVHHMNETGMSTKEVRSLLSNLINSYESIDFTQVKSDYDKLKAIYNNAFEAKALIEELTKSIEESEKNGIKVIEAKKLLYLGEIIYERGDFALALTRLKEAKSAYSFETKGEFNLIYNVKNHPIRSLIIVLVVGLGGLGSSLLIRFNLLKRKLRMLREEEVLLLELMKVVQREAFDKNKMSMEEYESAMMQYENRLSQTVEEKIRVETKMANMLKFSGRRKALGEEKRRLIEMVKKVQDDYLNKGIIETRIYENMIRSYTARLSEVQEEIATLDAEEAMKKESKIRKIFRR